jgi:hypothetical protein
MKGEKEETMEDRRKEGKRNKRKKKVMSETRKNEYAVTRAVYVTAVDAHTHCVP